jgi:hypothetical protein
LKINFAGILFISCSLISCNRNILRSNANTAILRITILVTVIITASGCKFRVIICDEVLIKLICFLSEGGDRISRRLAFSAIGIATGYGLDDRRGRSSSTDRVKNFLFSTSSRPVLGPTQPPIQWVMGAVSPGVKRQGREADHSPAASAEVKKM